MNKIRKKCLLTARGPIQFIAGLNAMEWHLSQVQGILEFDYYLLLYGMGGEGDALYTTINSMAQIRQWKKIYIANDKIAHQIMHRKRMNASINECKRFIAEEYFDNVYLEYDLGGMDRVIMNTFKQAYFITYGDAFGNLIDQKSSNRCGMGNMGYDAVEVLKNKFKGFARKALLGGFSGRKFDLAVLAIPIDETGHQLNNIPLIIPAREAILGIVKEVSGQMPGFQEYCVSLVEGQLKDSYLYLLCNFCELKMMPVDNEVKMYEDMVRSYSPVGSLVLLKPHPRTSSDFLVRLVALLEKDYKVKIIADEKFGRLPIEMWIYMIENCRIVNVFSSSMMNIKYLYNTKVIFALNDGYVKKYFYLPIQDYIREYCRIFNELLNRLESWDGKAYLWKRGDNARL